MKHQLEIKFHLFGTPDTEWYAYGKPFDTKEEAEAKIHKNWLREGDTFKYRIIVVN